jgi:agmatinase
MPERPPGLIDLNRYDFELSYSGFQTFLKLPVALTSEDLRAGQVDVAIGGIPWDGTTSSRTGTSLGPRGIRIADHQWTVGQEKYHLGVGVDFFKHLRMADFGDAQVLHGAIELSFKNMKTFVGQIADGGAIPIIMGGDHAVSWPNVAALAEHHGFGRIGVVHFDAHADTAPLMPGQYASHGSHFRQLIDAGAINPKNFVQIGLRGYWPGPDILGWQAEVGVRSHFMAEILRYGFDTVLERAINEAMEGADLLFLSVDIDVMDPAFAPGTGSPEPGGLTSAQILTAVRRIVHEAGIIGMDVVEVSPPMDVGNNITALLATRVIWEALTGLAMRKAGITQRDYLDPRFANEIAERG